MAKVYADGVPLCRIRFPGDCGLPDPSYSTCPCQIPVSSDGTVCFSVVAGNATGPLKGTTVSVTFSGCTTTAHSIVKCVSNAKGIANFCICGSVVPPCTATIKAAGVTLCTVPVVSATAFYPPNIFADGLDGTAGNPLAGKTPELGGAAWAAVSGYNNTIEFGPYGGVQEPGPKDRNTQSVVGSVLTTPFPLTKLAAYDVLHLQVVMANIAANPVQNVLESSRVDLITDPNLPNSGQIFLGEIGTNGFWGANSGASVNPIQSGVTTKQHGDFLLDLYLDPNDVFGDGPYNNAIMAIRPTAGPATAMNSGSYVGHIDGLSCNTTIYRVDLIDNVDDEARFDNLSLSVSRGGPKTIFAANWCPDCSGPPHVANRADVETGGDIAGTLPWAGGQPWEQGGLQGDQFHVQDPNGVEDAGPNSRNSNSWVTSELIQPFDLSTLAAYEGLHLSATMANISADADANPLESSRVDLLTNTSGSFISLGELGTDRNWGANSFAGDPLTSADSTTWSGQTQLDLYLDPNDAVGDGPSPNAYLTVDNGTWVPGTIVGLSSDSASATIISGVRLVRNVDDEVLFDDLVLERADVAQAVTVSVSDPGARSTHPVLVSPNPFRSGTEVRFSLEEPADVEVFVFDLAGRRVRSLRAHGLGLGKQVVRWDGLDDSGVKVRSGVYFVRVRSLNKLIGARVVLLN